MSTPPDHPPTHSRFLLGQLGANGDCLYATAVARQIKHDHPGCHLTWAIGSSCRRLLEGNPHVDEVWEFPPLPGETSDQTWWRFAPEARRRKQRGDFDEIYLTQIAPDHFYRSEGGVRATIFRGYPKPITVPVAPVLCLSDDEVRKVRAFAEEHFLDRYRQVILFECSPKSVQSRVTPDFALSAAESLVAAHPDVCVILSSNLPVRSSLPGIIDASSLTFRENAELSKHCTLLIGCSSGITWICTSEWAKPLPMIQLLSADYAFSASVVNDFTRWSLPTAGVIEMTDWDQERLLRCVEAIMAKGFGPAKADFGQPSPPASSSYEKLLYVLLRERRFTQAIRLGAQLLWRRDRRRVFLGACFRVAARIARKDSGKKPLSTDQPGTI